MRKVILTIVAIGALTVPFGGVASAQQSENEEPVLLVTDPTASAISGNYESGRNRGFQHGYVAVYADGVVVCNAADKYWLLGNNLQGYVWVGPDHAPDEDQASTPLPDLAPLLGVANNKESDGEDTGRSPCPDTRASDDPDE